ncbi:aspartate--tRNA(Asn) ligase [uncultured Acetatifactor sp.]|jgi:nondiscriminating aspartyl-tRNA synthetase|uniref:aspartate--tRNA(Asn) ligase n=1 Tax=uncultured Acetatifactor sp. TaxID=1671927 RepID=UPI0026143D95|nr:aspartate--tRNA(Asn) ligase [uncultured Acetatifactor sp.]
MADRSGYQKRRQKMSERVYIKDVAGKIGTEVKLQGFADNIRNSKSMLFIVLKDITGKVQITLEKEKAPELAENLEAVTNDSVLTVIGQVAENEYVKLGGIEIIPKEISVESVAEALPIARKEIPATKKKKAVERSSIDQRIDYRWIDLRTEENQLMFQVQTTLVNAMRQYLLKENFIEIHTPKLIGAASESGADVFQVEYFDRKAYLAQSPQFYKQMAMASGFERIFEVGPVFRAEKSFTSKHTTEFTGFDLEFSYIDSFRDVMRMEENLLRAGLEAVQERHGEQIKELFGMEVIVPDTPFPVVTLKELYRGLEQEFGYTVEESEKGDLTTDAERLSFEWVKKHYGHEFLFVTDYSAQKRAFYHMRDENGVPQGYDLVWRGVEITTGAQREHRWEVLKKQAEEKGLAEDVKFYLEFFRYGCPPHGGFGIGVDRLTMLLMGLTIKDAMFLFRGPNRLTP